MQTVIPHYVYLKALAANAIIAIFRLFWPKNIKNLPKICQKYRYPGLSGTPRARPGRLGPPGARPCDRAQTSRARAPRPGLVRKTKLTGKALHTFVQRCVIVAVAYNTSKTLSLGKDLLPPEPLYLNEKQQKRSLSK